jgi:GTP-binding protein LepA
MSTDIRNFCIIAHVDHGKTTLTDRLLQVTQTVAAREFSERLLDSNPIEKERGITIKLAPVRMRWKNTILNLIDTPGHVDFGYEVSRSLAACEGAVLVVDATQGVQAQTLSNFDKAMALGLTIIPVINKVDLPSADVENTMLEMMDVFHIKENDILHVSAKTGLNIEALLDAIIARIPTPTGQTDAPLRALVFTSYYDTHRGVVAYVRVVDGELHTQDKLHLIAGGTSFQSTEIGVFTPAMTPTDVLHAGEVGYLCTGLKEVAQVTVGDTITQHTTRTTATRLPGYHEPQPMVYLELYPLDGDDFPLLQDAMAKLTLNDASLQYAGTHSLALGNGLRVGFLGILHADIVRERLEREFDLELIATSPSVTYQITLINGETQDVHTPAELPDPATIAHIAEPITRCQIFTPRTYLGGVMQLVEAHRGTLEHIFDLGPRVRMIYTIPLNELITTFHAFLNHFVQK